MTPFKKTFQTLPTSFLPLSNEVSQPFVIPNVSPTSSPVLQAQTPTLSATLPEKQRSLRELVRVGGLVVGAIDSNKTLVLLDFELDHGQQVVQHRQDWSWDVVSVSHLQRIAQNHAQLHEAVLVAVDSHRRQVEETVAQMHKAIYKSFVDAVSFRLGDSQNLSHSGLENKLVGVVDAATANVDSHYSSGGVENGIIYKFLPTTQLDVFVYNDSVLVVFCLVD